MDTYGLNVVVVVVVAAAAVVATVFSKMIVRTLKRACDQARGHEKAGLRIARTNCKSFAVPTHPKFEFDFGDRSCRHVELLTLAFEVPTL